MRSASFSASQTGRAVALAMRRAETQNLLWSSMPVRHLSSVPSRKWKPPTMSICQSSIERDRSQRT